MFNNFVGVLFCYKLAGSRVLIFLFVIALLLEKYKQQYAYKQVHRAKYCQLECVP